MDLRERAHRAHLGETAARRHPWEVARADAVAGLVGRALRGHSGVARVVDVGAGDAYVAARLLTRFPQLDVTCVDAAYSDDDLARLRAPALHPLRALSEAGTALFSGALLLDVLEHVDDDVALAADTAARVAADGFLIVTVPAWPALFSHHDRALGHVRRYTPGGLLQTLRAAGLDVRAQGALFASLLPLRAVARLREAKDDDNVDAAAAHDAAHDAGHAATDGAGTDVAAWRGGAWPTALLTAGLRLDTAVTQLAARAGLRVPGLSLYALCTPQRSAA